MNLFRVFICFSFSAWIADEFSSKPYFLSMQDFGGWWNLRWEVALSYECKAEVLFDLWAEIDSESESFPFALFFALFCWLSSKNFWGRG